MDQPEAALRTRGLTKAFRGFVAVDGVDLDVQAGHVHALVVGSLADRVTVLQFGTILVEGPYETIRNDPQVIAAYLGEAPAGGQVA